MSIIRTLLKDGFDTELQIQGARSQNSNDDICSVVFTNYDNDTSNVYRMAEIVMRDNYGNNAMNGYGNMIIKTSDTGGCNINERVIIKHNGYVGIATCNPREMLDINGNIVVRGNVTACNILTSSEPSYISLNNKIVPINSNVFSVVHRFSAVSQRPIRIVKVRSFIPEGNSGTFSMRLYNTDTNNILGIVHNNSNNVPAMISISLGNNSASNMANLELQALGTCAKITTDGILLFYAWSP